MRMKNCSAGTHVSLQESSSDRNCSSCENETFSNKTNANTCTPWSNCTKGTYVIFPGDDLSDRTCLSCGYGTFNNKTINAQNCMPWQDCPIGQGASPEGTTESDRVCVPCALGRYSKFSQCTDCPDGFYCKEGLKNICPPGKYGKSNISIGDRDSPDSSCESCETGKYRAIENSSVVKACVAIISKPN